MFIPKEILNIITEYSYETILIGTDNSYNIRTYDIKFRINSIVMYSIPEILKNFEEVKKIYPSAYKENIKYVEKYYKIDNILINTKNDILYELYNIFYYKKRVIKIKKSNKF